MNGCEDNFMALSERDTALQPLHPQQTAQLHYLSALAQQTTSHNYTITQRSHPITLQNRFQATVNTFYLLDKRCTEQHNVLLWAFTVNTPQKLGTGY